MTSVPGMPCIGWLPYEPEDNMPFYRKKDAVNKCLYQDAIYNRNRNVGFGITLTPAIWPENTG